MDKNISENIDIVTGRVSLQPRHKESRVFQALPELVRAGVVKMETMQNRKWLLELLAEAIGQVSEGPSPT